MNERQLKRMILEEIQKTLKEEGGLGSNPKSSQPVWAKMSNPTFVMELSALLQKAGLSISNKNELLRSIISSNGVQPLVAPNQNSVASR